MGRFMRSATANMNPTARTRSSLSIESVPGRVMRATTSSARGATPAWGPPPPPPTAEPLTCEP